MRPNYPFNGTYIISKDSDDDAIYRAYVEDGVFGGYLVTAGFAS